MKHKERKKIREEKIQHPRSWDNIQQFKQEM